MARKIWQGDFAQFWFGPRGEAPPVAERRPRKARPAKARPAEAGRPLGIVEAHRKALREKRVLKPQP